MNISCSYCWGRIHERGYICEQKAAAEKSLEDKRRMYKQNSVAAKFRATNKWAEKSRAIKKRDLYICQCCKMGIQMNGYSKQYNTEELEVHHIVPIIEDYDLRLDDDNLITVCRYHHELCEKGIISREQQRMLVCGGDDGAYDDDVYVL